MVKPRTLHLLFVLVVVSGIACMASMVEARKTSHHHAKSRDHSSHHKKSKGSKSSKSSSGHGRHAPAPSPSVGPHGSRVFDVVSFGAIGDGVSDDSKALEAAWEAACKVTSATIEIPPEFKFLVNPVTLQGPCMPGLVLHIDGSLLAPPNLSSWSKSSYFQWINFKWLEDFTIRGSGTVNGQGSSWWNLSPDHYLLKILKHTSDQKPTALRFYGSHNVTVEDIAIVNSPQCHLKFDDCDGVKVDNITISSPEKSPNTDGIHLQNTRDVEIKHSNIGCGDDCVSIQTGCSNVHLNHITCGPGHGIRTSFMSPDQSLGGLGKDNSVACVSNITVENIIVQNALSGVRIKTWQGGFGSVRNVTFSSIQVTDVKVPIMIDQFYCDKKHCKNQTRAVEISGVNYNQATGTYSVQPIHLACSDAYPCTDVNLIDIQLSPSLSSNIGFQQALCWNSYGDSQAPLVPSSVNCLQKAGGHLLKSAMSRSHASSIC